MSRAWSRAPAAPVDSGGALVLGVGLAAVAVSAWLLMVRNASMAMPPPGAVPSLAEGARSAAQWGVMMAAMMLPSAAPLVLLYRTVSRRLLVKSSAECDRAVPAALFAAVYLVVWLALGVAIYGAHVAVAWAAARWPRFEALVPDAVAGELAAAGGYQLTGAKRACLRYCESPLGFLMRRWRSGYAATLRLSVAHAGYCVGCCWGLMTILVAAGAMSLRWVAAITIVVFAEKVLPRGWRTAPVVGVALLGLAVALRPELAGTMTARCILTTPTSRSFKRTDWDRLVATILASHYQWERSSIGVRHAASN